MHHPQYNQQLGMVLKTCHNDFLHNLAVTVSCKGSSETVLASCCLIWVQGSGWHFVSDFAGMLSGIDKVPAVRWQRFSLQMKPDPSCWMSMV